MASKSVARKGGNRSQYTEAMAMDAEAKIFVGGLPRQVDEAYLSRVSGNFHGFGNVVGAEPKLDPGEWSDGEWELWEADMSASKKELLSYQIAKGIHGAKTSEAILSIVKHHLRDRNFNARIATSALGMLVKFDRLTGTEKELCDLLGSLEDLFYRLEMDPRARRPEDLALTLSYLAKLIVDKKLPYMPDGGPDLRLIFGFLCRKAQTMAKDFNGQDLAMIGWAITKTGLQFPKLVPQLLPVFAALCDAVMTKLNDFNKNQRALANLMWAIPKIFQQVPSVFAALCDAAMPKVSDFDEQGLANIMYAIAKAGLQVPLLPPVFGALLAAVMPKVKKLNVQELANIMWAIAKTGLQAPRPVFEALCDAVMTKLMTKRKDFNQLALANIMWAIAKTGQQFPSVFEALCDAAMTSVNDFDEQALAMIMWAIAKTGLQVPRLPPVFAALCKAVMTKDFDFNKQERDMIRWAIAKTGLQVPLADAVMTKVNDFNQQTVANIM